MPKGRPPLSEETVQERITDYCARHGVTALNESGFPVYPAGGRETPQHREWVVLFKAWSRARRRSALATGETAGTRPGHCPICVRPLGPRARAGQHPGGPDEAPMHPRCRQLLETAEELGPAALDRAKALAASRHASGRSRNET
jgi:hypothetical protein